LAWPSLTPLPARRVAACLSAQQIKPQEVASLIAAEDAKVVVLTGAGVSVSAGIPDFRTPGTGLYDNLKEYDLPYPEAVFDLGYYVANPAPFQRLCKELWPGNFNPTPTHAFLKVLHDEGKLLRVFTQNIDSLESAAGVPADAIVAAHGNFDEAYVVGTGRPVPPAELRAAAFGEDADWRALENRHGGRVKPSITFFGENLPRRFFERTTEDLPKATLLLVMGTSLQVQPFASLIGKVRPGTPRVLINRDRVGEYLPPASTRGFDFESVTDGFMQGECDDVVRDLCSTLGWEAKLQDVLDDVTMRA
jgi:NAD-dependent SIR2 family protein deacetylase